MKRVEPTKIHLQAQGGMPINCYYHVFGERQDIERLVVEYEGEDYEDRPDKEGNDPAFSNRINTRTI